MQHPICGDVTKMRFLLERTNEVYLPMNRVVDNDWLLVEAEDRQSWPPKT